MSLGLWPDAVPFDPESGTASRELQEHFDAAKLPAAVLLVCSRDLRGSEWAARTAFGLARALSDGDRKVVLADLDFEQPSLHELAGEANAEGVADALLFGASLERVTVEPAGESFGFVPVGAFAPDPGELMASGAWPRIFAELAAHNTILLAYAPLGAAGLDAIAERISAVIILGSESEVAQTAALLAESIRVEGVISPVAPPPEEVPAPVAPEEEAGGEGEAPGAAAVGAEEPAAAGEGAGAEEWATAPETPEPAGERLELQPEPRPAAAAAAEPAQPVAPAGDGGETSATVTSTASPTEDAMVTPAGRIESVIRYARIGVVVAVLAIGGWFVGRLIAGRSEAEIATAPASRAGAPAEPAGQLLGFSVAIESYDRLQAAIMRADSLAILEPGLGFYVAPVVVDGAMWYRVLAGPLADSATAASAALALADRGLKLAVTDWDVRSTPLAFLLGSFEDSTEARQAVTAMGARDLPAYIVEVPYTNGPPRFHVYAGAYSGPSEAEPMRGLLRGAGIQDTLVLRLGRDLP